jgi:hypothetical protein
MSNAGMPRILRVLAASAAVLPIAAQNDLNQKIDGSIASWLEIYKHFHESRQQLSA